MIKAFRALVASIRLFFMRRAARKLLALALPRGLPPAPEKPLCPSLRMPPPFEAPPGEFWTLPLGAQAIRGQAPRRLFRLAALPRPPRKLDVVRDPPTLRELSAPLLQPRLLLLVRPLDSRVHALGIARPASFRLDGELRLPTEIDPLPVAPERPLPKRPRRVRPRTPLARAPLARLRRRNFRIDEASGQGANEEFLPERRRDTSYWWVRREFKQRFLDRPWMARDHIAFLKPLEVEWFTEWWFQNFEKKPGGRDPVDYPVPDLWWTMQECKEQMLIRRDVKKDETPPPEQEYFRVETDSMLDINFDSDLSGLTPPKEWVVVGPHMIPPPTFLPQAREAYLQWKTLMNSLEEPA